MSRVKLSSLAPWPARYGAILVKDSNSSIFWCEVGSLGIQDATFTELSALLHGLRYIQSLPNMQTIKEGDSQWFHSNGQTEFIKNLENFAFSSTVKILHVKREVNHMADGLANIHVINQSSCYWIGSLLDEPPPPLVSLYFFGSGSPPFSNLLYLLLLALVSVF